MAKIIRREWTSREMTTLGRPHFTQEINGGELNHVSLVWCQAAPKCEQGLNGFTRTDEPLNFFTKRNHGGFSF